MELLPPAPGGVRPSSIPSMARIELVREVALAPQEAWERVTDWPRHGDSVPFTTVRSTSAGIVGRTQIGPFGFDDVMDLTVWEPPLRCRLDKRGRVVTGWAEITVEPSGTGSRVTWVEELDVAGVPALFDPVKRQAARVVFGRLLDGLLR